MRVNSEFIKKNWHEIQENTNNYMVLDIEHLGFAEDEQAFENGLVVLNLYNSLRMVNSFFTKFGISENIDASIIGEMVNSFYSGKPFTDIQLEEMVTLYKRIEHLSGSIENISPMFTDASYIPTSVLLSLIGFDLYKQYEYKTSNSAKFTEIKEEFYKLEDKLFDGEITVQEFRVLGLNMFNELKK